jgi:Carboxypeptidase regulatory-like domain/TonB dependent receptor
MANGQGFGKRICVYLCTAFLVVLFCALRAPGQSENGAITGTVTDPSGGAIVSAKVEATNVGTNTVQNTVSDSSGRYRLADLAVGTYNVEVSNDGFKTVVHSGIVLVVGETIVVDFSLPIGQISQTVNVESDVSRVETQTSEVSTLVSPEQMRDLPLNGRNFEQLITLAPGVATVAAALNNFVVGRLYGAQDNYSISGSRPTGQMFLLDNTDIRDFWEHGTGSGYGGTSLGVEAIGEFQLLTNTYTAQFAGNGVVMNATSRSGTNDFHGGAYEFFRNSALDARDTSDVFAGLSSPPPFKRNQFGAAVGGPIKKDKLFFFANYEGLRQGLESTTPVFVPEPYLVNGQLPCGAPGSAADVLVNTTNAACIPLQALQTGPQVPDPNNPGQTIASWVPVTGAATGINPVVTVPGALAQTEDIAKIYSLCKGCRAVQSSYQNFPGTLVPAGTDLGGYLAASTFPNLVINEDYTLDRVDYNLGPNDSAFARFVFDDARVQDAPRDPLGIFPELDFSRNQFLTITERHTFSATLLNSARFGYTRDNENSRVPAHLSSAQLTTLGFASDPLFFNSGFADAALREDGQVNAGTATVIVTPVGPDQNRPDQIVQSKFSGGDDVVWSHGPHTIKFGVIVVRVQTNNDQTAYANGTLYFAGTTQSSFLLGQFGAAFAVPEGFTNSTRYFREIDVAPYIQDDWKITPKLTLNFGLRYDYTTNPVGWARGGGSLTTIIGSFQPPLGLQTPGTFDPAVPSSIFSPVKHVFATDPNAANFGPRIGFAYSPFADNKTSIRGGFGVFHDPVAARIYESGFIATPPALSTLVFGPGFPDFSTGFVPAPGEFAGVTYQVPHGAPYEMQWNLNIQRQIANGTVLSVGYVGSAGRHLWQQFDGNIPECDTFPNCTAIPTINAPNTGAHFTGATFPGFTPRINPNLGSTVLEYETAESNYNSLQVSLNRQFSHNLAGQVNYTWSHCLDDGSFATSLEEFSPLLLDSYNPKYDYGNCEFDVRQNLSANGLYSLPFKGNRFVQGWELATIVGIHSGQPLDIAYPGVDAADPNYLGSQWGSRPNYSGAAGCHPNHILDSRAPGSLITQWFDPSCYTPQASGYFGNVIRDSIPGPGTVGFDFSIIKNTKITENLNMQFRAEAFNIINHYNPGAPNTGFMSTEGALATGQSLASQAPVVTPRQIQFAVKLDF